MKIKITYDALGRDIHSSTWIEGNTLSLEQVLALIDGKNIHAEDRQKNEVKNCINVLRWIMNHTKTPLTPARVFKLHAQMTKELLSKDRSGHWRKIRNYIVNAKRQVIFTPPKSNDVPKRMKELMVWLSKSKKEHAVVRSAIFHHEFVAIHPFVDGNGRMARALSQGILLQGNYDPAHSLGLDEYFAADRTKYYQMINKTHEMDGDYTHWIEYFAAGLLVSIKRISQHLQSARMDSRDWTPKQRELTGLLKKEGILGSKDICKKMKINRARVNQLIVPLIAAGIILKKGHTRLAKYEYAKY